MSDQASDATGVVMWCAHAGVRRLHQGVCAPPCEAVHLRCSTCGTAIGGCPFETPSHRDLHAPRFYALNRDKTLARHGLALVERAAQAGAPVTWSAARSTAIGQLAGC